MTNAVRYGLTRRQGEVLAWLKVRLAQPGAAPTLAEIGKGIGTRSHSRVAELLDALQARGYLRRLPAAPRSIALTEDHTR